MRVIIIGAGIGGLALAQSLHHAGIDISVHDRDHDVADTGGYRLHLDHHACAALRRHLPPALYQALLGSSAGSEAFRRMAFVDHRMRILFDEARDREEDTLLVGRIPLRRLLTHGLDDVLHLDHEFTHHETHADGTVTAHFADGSTDRGDLLVGADGVGSRVARALAGGPTSHPLGVSGLAGRTHLTDAVRALLPATLRTGPALAIGPDGIGMFLSLHDPAGATVVDPGTCVTVPADVERGDVVWGINAADDRFPADARTLDTPALQRAAVAMLDGWDDDVRALVAAPAAAVGIFGFHAAGPDADLTPWPAGVVTAIGDAVHAMPPTGGRAAATAVRDADLLTRHLLAVRKGTSTIPLAVHAYEQRMPTYAADAIRESLAPLTWTRRLSAPGADRLARVALPVLAAVHRLGHGA